MTSNESDDGNSGANETDHITSHERQHILKRRLATLIPTEAETLVLRSAVFNIVTMASIGAASLGMSARLFAKARPGARQTAVPTLLGTLTGLVLGGFLGVDRGMRKLQESLPPESELRSIMHEFATKNEP